MSWRRDQVFSPCRVAHYNRGRPHASLGPGIPMRPTLCRSCPPIGTPSFIRLRFRIWVPDLPRRRRSRACRRPKGSSTSARMTRRRGALQRGQADHRAAVHWGWWNGQPHRAGAETRRLRRDDAWTRALGPSPNTALRICSGRICASGRNCWSASRIPRVRAEFGRAYAETRHVVLGA
jgi:hypothetical protein